MNEPALKNIALFPGSFDPVTKGHENIINRALPLFDEIVVAIGRNAQKQAMFPLEKRRQWLEKTFNNDPKITVRDYEGLTVDYCKKLNARYIIRGIRSVADVEYERNIAEMNAALAPEIETIFLFSAPGLTAINSSIVRDIIRNKGDFRIFIPENIAGDI